MEEDDAAPTTTGPLSPCPIFFLQTTAGPREEVVTMGAPDDPLRSGPRNCGQSAAAGNLNGQKRAPVGRHGRAENTTGAGSRVGSESGD